MNIENCVQEKFQEIVSSGFIEEQIKKALEKTVAESIEESLRSWSDFGKELKSKISEAVKIEKLELKLPEYNQLVCNWIIEMINDQLIADSRKQIGCRTKK